MINWPLIDTILLDLDGTLLDLHFDNYFWQTHLIKRYAEHHAIPEIEAKKQLLAAFKSVEGTQAWYCLDYWQDALDLNILALKQEVQHLIAVHPHVESFLQRAKTQKKLILVTNAHPDSLKLKLNKTQLGPYFDQIISAHDYGEPKEEQRFWQHLSEKISFEKKRTLLIDDNLAVLRAARTYGISHLITITQPDSQKATTPTTEFTAARTFKELLPGDLE